MALNLSGEGGELRQGRRTLARLATWTKADTRVTFATSYVNAFAAGLGPPTEIALPVRATVTRVYPVLSGGLDTGAVRIDLMAARTETRPT